MKRKFLKAISAAFVSSLFLSMTGIAAEDQVRLYYDVSALSDVLDISGRSDPIIIESGCGGEGKPCPGHTITGTTTNVPIVVKSGEHDIHFRNLTIDASNLLVEMIPLDIGETAKVNLYLEGTNILTGNKDSPGISVPKGAQLNIYQEPDTKDGILTATGGKTDAAGIGVSGGKGAAGNISIFSGTVTAVGKGKASGIGGCGEGSVGTVAINGGLVFATGGNTPYETDSMGSPGIGGGYKGSGGKVILNNGGKLVVNGGTGTLKDDKGKLLNAPGIKCDSVTSGYGFPAIIEGTIGETGTFVNDNEKFNGIVKDGTKYKVYGNAIIDSSFVLNGGTMEIGANATLTIPDQWNFTGKITGSGGIINLEQIGPNHGDIATTLTSLGVLKETDFLLSDPNTVRSIIYDATDLQNDFLQRRFDRTSTNDKLIKIDDTGWTKTIYKQNSETSKTKVQQMKDVGVYRVTYTHKAHDTIEFKDLSISPRLLSDGAIGMLPEANLIYDGTEKKPEVTVTHYSNKASATIELEQGKDYSVSYTNNVNKTEEKPDVDKASYTIQAIEPGNYTGSVTRPFEIARASIGKAEVTAKIAETDVVYDGNVKTPDITVTLGESGTPLQAGDKGDYDVSYALAGQSIDAPKDAGEVTVKVTGKGNYKDSATGTFEIKKRPLAIKTVSKAEPKQYDGKKTVTVKGDAVDLDTTNAVQSEIGQIFAPDFEATVEGAEVGTYQTISFPELTCTGDNGRNYSIPAGNGIQLINPVTISKQAGDTTVPKLTVEYEVSSLDPTKFRCTVTAAPEAPEGYRYVYKKITNDGTVTSTEWSIGNVYDGIEPLSSHTFQARLEETAHREAGALGETTYKFELKDRAAPPAFEMEQTEQLNGKIRIKIPQLTLDQGGADAVYAITDSKDVPSDFDKDGYIREDCEPGNTYYGHVKFLATETQAESPVTMAEIKTTLRTVKTPTFGLQSNIKLLKGQKISINCDTPDSKIYYTLNGKSPAGDYDNPDVASDTQEYKGEFELPDTIKDGTKVTIKAIGVARGMANSQERAAIYEKAKASDIITEIEGADPEQAIPDYDSLEVPPELADLGYGQEDMTISKALATSLTDLGEALDEHPDGVLRY